MLCGWEGNHRPGVALATRHSQIQLFIHLRAQWPRKGRWQHSLYAPVYIRQPGQSMQDRTLKDIYTAETWTLTHVDSLED